MAARTISMADGSRAVMYYSIPRKVSLHAGRTGAFRYCLSSMHRRPIGDWSRQTIAPVGSKRTCANTLRVRLIGCASFACDWNRSVRFTCSAVRSSSKHPPRLCLGADSCQRLCPRVHPRFPSAGAQFRPRPARRSSGLCSCRISRFRRRGVAGFGPKGCRAAVGSLGRGRCGGRA